MREPKLKRPKMDGPVPAANETIFHIQAPYLIDTQGAYDLLSFDGIKGAYDRSEAYFALTSQSGSAVFNLKNSRLFNRIEMEIIPYPDGVNGKPGGVLVSFNDGDGDIVELYTGPNGSPTGVRVYDPVSNEESILGTFSGYTSNEPFVFGFEAELDQFGEPLYQQITVYYYSGRFGGYDDRTILWDVQDQTIFGLNADSLVIGARAEYPDRVANVGSKVLGIMGVYTG